MTTKRGRSESDTAYIENLIGGPLSLGDALGAIAKVKAKASPSSRSVWMFPVRTSPISSMEGAH